MEVESEIIHLSYNQRLNLKFQMMVRDSQPLDNKKAKDLSRHFSEEDKRTVTEHMKRCSAPSVMRLPITLSPPGNLETNGKDQKSF